jgi:hypothetical protein
MERRLCSARFNDRFGIFGTLTALWELRGLCQTKLRLGKTADVKVELKRSKVLNHHRHGDVKRLCQRLQCWEPQVPFALCHLPPPGRRPTFYAIPAETYPSSTRSPKSDEDEYVKREVQKERFIASIERHLASDEGKSSSKFKQKVLKMRKQSAFNFSFVSSF